MQAYSSNNGGSNTGIDPDTGEYMFVLSPGAWRPYYTSLQFDYPSDPDPHLASYISRYEYLAPYTVGSGETQTVDLTYGTATVRLFYYVAGGEMLSSPYFRAVRTGIPSAQAYAYGSPYPTTEGQAIGTLFPGTYTIEAFANVEGSTTEFGTFTVIVEDGDVVVIGGPARPTIKVTNPTEGEVIPYSIVTVEGTGTDDVGVASITVNGNPVDFTLTGNPDDPNEVAFSHEVSLPVIGENTITVVATDVDGTPPVTLTLTVIREQGATPTTLTYTGNTLAQVNIPATLAAELVDEGGLPISEAEISFNVEGQSCSGVTGENGVASCYVTIPTAGVYDVIAEFAGDDLHQSSTATALLTVYDPEGGFVTGGGWINSPVGACPDFCGDATGKANFGFVSKYKKGATVPTGNTQFNFKAGDLNFHSDTYEWLLVNQSGTNAQFKGSGTINGDLSPAGEAYKFMLWATDGDPDTFRIKIWWEEDDFEHVVYDNGFDGSGNENGQPIDGGSIVVHT
jgi:hypothetical protein